MRHFIRLCSSNDSNQAHVCAHTEQATNSKTLSYISLSRDIYIYIVGYILCDSVKKNNNYNNKSVTVNK